MTLYYQINYTLTDVPEDAAYFHAQFRRVPKLPAKSVYTILDGVRGRGQYVGTYLAWEVQQSRLVGRRGDQVLHRRRQGVSHDLRHRHRRLLLRLVRLREPGDAPLRDVQHALHRPGPGAAARQDLRCAGQRFGLYRWHIADPVRFSKDLKVTIQALGWQSGGRVPAAGGRHRLGGLLVSDRAARQVPGISGQRRAHA